MVAELIILYIYSIKPMIKRVQFLIVLVDLKQFVPLWYGCAILGVISLGHDVIRVILGMSKPSSTL